MIKKINNNKRNINIFLFVSVLVLGIFAFITKEVTWINASIALLISNVIIFFLLQRAYRSYEENSIKVGDKIGSEAANAMIFGAIGLIMYDENHCIIWQSDLFHQMGIDLVGVPLKQWHPLLEEQFDSDDIITLQIKDKTYDIYNNQDTRTLYIKDVTNFNELMTTYHHQRMVFGYLSIDNFDETLASVDEQKGAIIQSTIRSMLVDWASEYGFILRRYRSENYVMIMNELTYQKLVESKFAILGKVQKQANEFNVVLGLSMGIAHHEADLHLLDDAANDAYSLALSRGGDQVVVKSFDEPVRYFGGNSETKTKTSRVRVRIIAQSLNGLFKQADTIFIMGHKDSDLDSLGASLALMRIVKNYNIPVYIVVNPESIEAKTKRAYRLLLKTGLYDDIFVIPQRVSELVKGHSLLVSVDNHRKDLSIHPILIDLVDDIVVIDHHRRGEDFIANPILTYLEPAASSTVELITELYDYQADNKVKLTDLEATIMYAGMLVDTSNFKTRVGVRTFRVAATLKDMGADMAKATELLQDDFSFTLKKAEFIQSASRYNSSILIAVGANERIYTKVMLAKVGNELLEVDETEAAIVIGRIDENTVALSARSTGKINVQVIMEKMGGGGHFTMAASQMSELSVEEVKALLVSKLDEYYKEREA